MDASGCLGLALHERADEFARLLRDAPMPGLSPRSQRWLRRRYAEIVPIVLPSALTAIERGTPVDAECLAAVRAAAARCHDDPGASLGVALRGALPALQVFARVMRSASSVDAACTVEATSRSALVAHELATCWTEGWMAGRAAAESNLAGDSVTAAEVELVPVESDLDDSDRRIVALAAAGLSTEEIARETSYSRQAIAWHLGRLMKAWRAPNRTALVSLAHVKGWIAARRVRRGDG